ncbi:MAG: phosphoglycerate dehydrogenase [Candidatus Saccharibacteria bacterium]|nr:phosphoglycerate dehydrogenase [Candidatus Saccharibacteria bacterium]
MKQIVLAGSFNLTDEQTARIAAMGEVTKTEDFSNNQEWLDAIKGADVVCSDGSYLYANLKNLENVFVTYPYTELGSFDSEELATKNVYIANARGGNRKSIVEWAIFMTLSMYRQLPNFLRTTTQYPFTATESLEGKNVLIVGHGTIGTELGERYESFGMNVTYFNRSDNLIDMSANSDLVVNALNCNPSTENMLNASYFSSLKKGVRYLTFSRPFTYDIDGLISSIDAGIIAQAAIDCDPEPLFDISNDFYKKCLANEKILVTPHVAGITTKAGKNGTEIMVQNVEQFLAGTPQNIIKK